MRFPLFAAATLSAIALAACEPLPEEPQQPQVDPATCGADGYQSLVGAQLAAVSLPADLDARVIEPGMAVTMDFRASRLNIEVDEAGVIERVYCG